MSLRHDHTKVRDARAPEIQRVEMVKVTFLRGAGCCEISPVREVTAYFDTDGVILFEADPFRLRMDIGDGKDGIA